MKSSKQEYQQAAEEQAKKDSAQIVKTTEELIDAPMFEVCKFFEGRNIGELKAFRSMLQTHLDKVDVFGKKLVDNPLPANSKEDRISLGSVFALAGKIQDRMGYIDYLTEKNQLH